jgi:hypothetical protein
MATALDAYKGHYGFKNDGETVLRHAQFGHFKDVVTNERLTDEKLKELGVTAEMTREQILGCLSGKPGTIDRQQENVVQLRRYVLQQVIDFCSRQTEFVNSNRTSVQPARISEVPFMQKVHAQIVDPILDAIARKLYTGSFFRKKKPSDDL